MPARFNDREILSGKDVLRARKRLARRPSSPGKLMAKPSKLLEAYERMVAAEEEKHRLMPERLVTLVADKPWNRTIPNCRVRCLSSQSSSPSQTMVLRLAMESRLRTMCPSYHLQERSKGTPHMSDIPYP